MADALRTTRQTLPLRFFLSAAAPAQMHIHPGMGGTDQRQISIVKIERLRRPIFNQSDRLEGFGAGSQKRDQFRVPPRGEKLPVLIDDCNRDVMRGFHQPSTYNFDQFCSLHLVIAIESGEEMFTADRINDKVKAGSDRKGQSGPSEDVRCPDHHGV